MVQGKSVMKVVVVGAGYVGLVSGVCLAEVGHSVICVDENFSKVNSINRGDPPIQEEGLQELLKCQIARGRFAATTELEPAMLGADVSIIAVGTPFHKNAIDLTHVKDAALAIGRCLPRDKFHVVCVKSTVVPGTTVETIGPIVEEASGLRAETGFGICMNPEFLAEGTAVKDFMQPDRIVIGTRGAQTEERMRDLYAPFCMTDMYFTNPTTAEMIKYTSNALLATLISFSNEIADICTRCDQVDAVDVMRAVHLDKRLSPLTSEGRVSPGVLSYLHPGAGFGGSCFPKDLKAIASFGEKKGSDVSIIKSVISRNERQPYELVRILDEQFGGELYGRRVALLGLAFKPGTDDIRESPAIPILRVLLHKGVDIVAHDPLASANVRILFPDVSFPGSLDLVIADVEAVLLITAWPEYRDLPSLLGERNIPLIDGRRIISPNAVKNYSGIGIAFCH
jgi:UDPglucose 6-dehydrogenase